MKKWTVLGVAEIPNNGGELKLSQRDQEFSIRLSGIRGELMNSRVHGSEESLAELGCVDLANTTGAQVLIGGLGMGFTLMAALKAVNDTSTVTVAELIPEVVEWNQGPLGDCAGNPLRDPRTKVFVGDVGTLFNTPQAFDAILLDVDNGPEGLTHSENDMLYSQKALQNIYQALKPDGILAVWSAGPDPMFLTRLKKARFHASARSVRARPGKGSHHTIFLGRKSVKIGA
jgi:spermidine synthase